jgi:beta-lactam-binding protein with PASTA domain
MALPLDGTGKRYDKEIKKNCILSQELTVGSRVKKDSRILVVVSAGVESTVVPNIIGLPLEEAQKALSDANLTWETREEEYQAAPGTVAVQSVEPGAEEIQTGTTITLLVSKGLSGGDSGVTVTVPDVRGWDYDEASNLLIQDHLYLLKIDGEYSDTVPAGTIIRQEPEAGTGVYQQSNVKVAVSLGREMVPVPDVQYMAEELAAEKLSEAGFSVVVRRQFDGVIEKGQVIVVEPQAYQMEKGAEIMLVVSDGKQEEPQTQTQAPTQVQTQPQTKAQSQVPAQTRTQAPETTPEPEPEPEPAQTQPQPAATAPAETENPIFDIIGY